jgi:hypothetical protein
MATAVGGVEGGADMAGGASEAEEAGTGEAAADSEDEEATAADGDITSNLYHLFLSHHN